jgi:hypothetical protein
MKNIKSLQNEANYMKSPENQVFYGGPISTSTLGNGMIYLSAFFIIHEFNTDHFLFSKKNILMNK